MSNLIPHSYISAVSEINYPAWGEHIALESAQEKLLREACLVAEPESVPLMEAHNRVLFDDFAASIPQPPFCRVLVDGYALRHCDIIQASQEHPVMLRVAQRLYAGDGEGLPLGPGEAARVMTGAMLPPGADCAIWQEDTDGGEDAVMISRSLEKFRNCRMRGADIAEGQPLLRRGDTLHTVPLSLLAGQGVKQVRVFRRPKVAILATGDELHLSGESLPAGKIYNVSSVMLAARLGALGVDVTNVSNCCDDGAELHERMNELLGSNDILLTTGGVSGGKKDFIPVIAGRIATEQGGRVLFEGVRIKPGSLTLGMSVGRRMLIGLSGNPAPALTTFEMLVVPALKKISGRSHYQHERQRGIAQYSFGTCRKDSRRLIMAQMIGKRVYIRQDENACAIGHCAGDYNCFVDIPVGASAIKAGDEVNVILL